MKAIKWYYRYSELCGEAFETVDEAVRSAIHASEDGTESLACIETEDGERIESGHPTFIKIRREIEQMWASGTPDPTPTHYVKAQAPDGEWAVIESATTEADAAKCRDELAAVIGADRVDVRHRDQTRR